jgi:zinc and cadmium transporter
VSTFAWIVASGLAMSALALVGVVTLVLEEKTLQRLLLPLVAFAAGSLLGGAWFHMLPAALHEGLAPVAVFAWAAGGFSVFLALEQFLHWHHCHRAQASCKEPLTYLILIGDGVHNLLGGLAVGGTFLIDVRLGITTWIAAALHEIPQELGDFGVLVHGGWPKRKALLYSLLSALTFLVGSLLAYFASFQLSVAFLVPFAAGNFVYIGASDLVPEVNRSHSARTAALHFACFTGGLALLLALRAATGE